MRKITKWYLCYIQTKLPKNAKTFQKGNLDKRMKSHSS